MTYRIYVASLSDYNAGILHGAWIDLNNLDIDSLRLEINKILESSPTTKKHPDMPAEEWAIHDYELGGINISEYEDLDKVIEISIALKDLGEAFAIYYNLENHSDILSCKKAFEEAYCGEYDSFSQYAETLFDECYLSEVPEYLRRYIDYNAFANDLECDGHYEAEGHIFRPV